MFGRMYLFSLFAPRLIQETITENKTLFIYKVKKYSLFSIFRSLNLNQACILVLDIEKCPAKIELCPTKAASQLTQLPAVNLKQFFKIC